MKRRLIWLALAFGLWWSTPALANGVSASYACLSTGSTQLVGINGGRKGFMWQNTGTVPEVIAIGTGNGCNGAGPNGTVLYPGDVWKLPDGSEPVPTADISCCTATGTGVVSGMEW